MQSFKAALLDFYGDQIDRIVLLGSRARGDAGPQSDYDIAVFLKTLPDRWKELNLLATLRLQFIDEIGAFFDAFPYHESAYDERTPFMHEIRKDGLVL